MTFRVDEIYVSMQGEGPRVGTPTIFVRFGGCNLRCPGWACDTQHAIDIKYRDEWDTMNTNDIIAKCLELRKETGAATVCLTGGEPFLQPTADLKELCITLNMGLFAVECFSNGTIVYPPWAEDQIMFIMDWKLPGSGEGLKFTTNRQMNIQHLAKGYRPDFRQAVKFVIKDRADFDAAVKVWRFWLFQTDIQVFAGVVWGSISNEQLCAWILEAKLPWRLNVQVHNYVHDRNQRGI